MSYRGPSSSYGAFSSNNGMSVPKQKYNLNQKSSMMNNLKQAHAVFEKYESNIEDLTSHPIFIKIRPYVPAIARFFIVATFFEDSLRIFSQWKDQVFYLNKWKHYPHWFVVIFLFIVSISMFVGAIMIMLRKHTNYATGVLCSCVVLQALVYGLFTGSSFLLRNFSVIGGLLIVFSDSIVQNKTTFGMLPELSDKSENNKSYLLLAGRILMVLMFVAFTFSKSWFTVFITIINTACFAIGYKTKLASIMLVAILTFYNIYLNNYWFYDETMRDFLRYEFYQNLSIIGGLLLITNTGAGHISLDEKKKIY